MMSSGLSKIFSRRGEKRSVLNGECVFCGACITVCPVGNLEIIEKDMKNELVVGDNCKGCGECELICPVGAIILEKI